jgi:hypothetical protein
MVHDDRAHARFDKVVVSRAYVFANRERSSASSKRDRLYAAVLRQADNIV